jgi:ribonuclease R
MNADKAARAASARLCCLFMRGREGECFDAAVAHVAAFGLFVAAEPHGIEGLLRVGDLRRDYYDFDGKLLRLRGRRSGEEFTLGTPLRVKLAKVDMKNYRLGFVCADD